MYTRQALRRNLLGCLEIVLFMRRGITRFNTTKGAAIRSFLIPLILSPILLMLLAIESHGTPFMLMVSIHLPRTIISIAAFLFVTYALMRQFNRNKHFYQFVVATNWLSVPVTLFLLPIVVMLFTGTHTIAEIESYAIFTIIFGYVLTAFIATHALRIPWELGGFVAIVGLGIDQTTLDIASLVKDTLI